MGRRALPCSSSRFLSGWHLAGCGGSGPLVRGTGEVASGSSAARPLGRAPGLSLGRLPAPLQVCTLLRTAQEVAAALAYLHSRSILHGDLSSNNILLTSSTAGGPRRSSWSG
jgi:hypothetical protein